MFEKICIKDSFFKIASKFFARIFALTYFMAI